MRKSSVFCATASLCLTAVLMYLAAIRTPITRPPTDASAAATRRHRSRCRYVGFAIPNTGNGLGNHLQGAVCTTRA